MTIIGIAAEFHKDSSKRLALFSLWTVREEIDRHDGLTYLYHDGYDVDWSRDRQSYIFHNSSSGLTPAEVSGIYFMSGDIPIKEKPCTLVDARDKPPWRGKRTKAIRERNRTRRLAKLPKAFDIAANSNLLEWLQNNGIESDAAYCSICRDYFPTSEEWLLCEHIWWCSTDGWWSTPSERCGCKGNNISGSSRLGGEL